MLGFLVGFLIDAILEFALVRRRTDSFLADPEKIFLKRGETGKYSFFCLGTALCIASGGAPDKNRHALYRRLAEYYPLEREDTEYLLAIIENMDSLGPAPDLAAHAKEVRRCFPEGLLELYVGLLSFAEGPAIPSGSLSALILRAVAAIWDIRPPRTGIEEGPPSADEDPWRVLGLEAGAREAEVKKVFRLLASQFHPDGGWALSDVQRREMEEAFRRIREAYEACMRMCRKKVTAAGGNPEHPAG
jgi:hypothetical protein